MSTFVLVHGAWHGAWCWYQTAPRLDALGHRAIAVDLPAHGVDTTPSVGLSLHDQVAALCDEIDAQSGPVVLVGHSSGGAVITQAAESRPDAVETLVYLTAFLPPDGAAVMDLAQGDVNSQVLQNLVVDEASGHATIRPDAVATALYHDCTEADRQLAGSLLRPEPLGTLGAPVATTRSGFGRVRRVYIACRQDRAITPALQEAMYTDVPCEQVLSLDTGHSPFFSAPDDLAERLVRAAAPVHAA